MKKKSVRLQRITHCYGLLLQKALRDLHEFDAVRLQHERDTEAMKTALDHVIDHHADVLLGAYSRLDARAGILANMNRGRSVLKDKAISLRAKEKLTTQSLAALEQADVRHRENVELVESASAAAFSLPQGNGHKMT